MASGCSWVYSRIVWLQQYKGNKHQATDMTTKAVLRSIKNVTNGYSSAQVLVRECTSNDQASPTVSKMSEIADLTYKNGSFQDVMDIIDRRLNDKGRNWRHVAKALTLLDYLVRYGSDDVVIWAKDNLYIIKTLREFNTTDSAGNEQGSIIRVKAKELTSLLQDDERLKQERETAANSGSRGRRRGGNHRNVRRSSRYPPDDEIYDEDLQKALEESKMTAEEEEMRRRNQSDQSLERAIQISLEEEEMRKKKNNLLDLDDDPNPPDVYGFYQQQPQAEQNQIIGYDMFGNPVYANGPMATGYLQNAYQDLAAQQQQQQALLQQQQQMYQQQLAAAQLAAAQQQQMMMQTGSNNPFAQQQQQQYLQQQQQQQQQLLLQQQQEAEEEARRREEELKRQQELLEEQQRKLQEQQQRVQELQQQAQSPIKSTNTANQQMNDKYSELNHLLAQGTGLDTFGNTGDARLPAQFTKTGTFINSQGTGFKQVSNMGNPFLDTQFTGMNTGFTVQPASGANGAPNAASRIVPSETGYGFGNQTGSSNNNGGNQGYNPNSLIDL